MRVRNVALVLVGVVIVGIALARLPPDQRCSVGRDLAKARLLDDALLLDDRADCPAVGATAGRAAAKDVEAERRRAARQFARADAFAAAAVAAREARHPSKARRRRAARADRRELRALAAGLVLDPFRTGRMATFTSLVARAPEAAKGHHGKRRRNLDDCRLGRRLAAGGLPTEGAQLAGRAMLTHPGAKACRRAVRAVSRARARALRAHRRALAARGDQDADDAGARRQDAIALQADASMGASRQALVAAAAEPHSWLDDTVDAVAAFPGWLGGAWPALLALLIGLTALAAIGFHSARWRAVTSAGFKRHLLPDDGSGEDGSPDQKPPTALARRIARLHVRVADFDGGKDGELSGADVTTLLEHALTPRGPAAFPFDRLPAAAATDPVLGDIATVVAQLPEGGLAAAALRALPSVFAPRTATVAGRLLPADTGSPGIALSITAPHADDTETVLRARDIDPAPDGNEAEQQGRLVGPASVWVRRRLEALASEPRDDAADPPKSDDEIEAEMLATAGEGWAAAHDPVRAASCFARALALDSALLPAEHNLGVSLVHMGSYEAAAAVLESLCRRLPDDLDAEAWPGLREATEYNLTLALVYSVG